MNPYIDAAKRWLTKEDPKEVAQSASVEPLSGELPEIKPVRGKQPRNIQDRSKYGPHQGERECRRRIRQLFNGQLEMAGSEEAFNQIIEAACREAKRTLGIAD